MASSSTTNNNNNNNAEEEEEEHALYKLLNILPNATEKEIKKAYHTKARHVHPDRCGGTVEAKKNFQILQKAYEILSDPEKRKLYDRTGCTDTDNNQFWEAYKHYRQAFPEITKEDIFAFEKEYRHSNEEKQAIVDFYVKHKGNVSNILGFILCSRDEDIPRFIQIIDEAIEKKEIQLKTIYQKSKMNILTSQELDQMEMENGEDIGKEEKEEEEEEAGVDDDDDWIVYGEEDEDTNMLSSSSSSTKDGSSSSSNTSRHNNKKKENSKQKGNNSNKNKNTKKKIKKKKKKQDNDDDAFAALRAQIHNNKKKREQPPPIDDTDPMAALRAQIFSRGQERHTSMIDMLSAKYGNGNGSGSKKKRKGSSSSSNKKKKKRK